MLQDSLRILQVCESQDYTTSMLWKHIPEIRSQILVVSEAFGKTHPISESPTCCTWETHFAWTRLEYQSATSYSKSRWATLLEAGAPLYRHPGIISPCVTWPILAIVCSVGRLIRSLSCSKLQWRSRRVFSLVYRRCSFSDMRVASSVLAESEPARTWRTSRLLGGEDFGGQRLQYVSTSATRALLSCLVLWTWNVIWYAMI